MDSHGGWIARPLDLVQFLMHVSGSVTPPNILKPPSIRTMTAASAANPEYAEHARSFGRSLCRSRSRLTHTYLNGYIF